MKKPIKVRKVKRRSSPNRVMIGTRVSPEIKRRLDEAAILSGRSQAQEIELRLEKSFEQDDFFKSNILEGILRAAYVDEDIVGILTTIGLTIADGRLYIEWDWQDRNEQPPKHWVRDQSIAAGAKVLLAISALGSAPSDTAANRVAEQMIKALRGDVNSVFASRLTHPNLLTHFLNNSDEDSP